MYSGEKEIALSTAALRAGDPHGAAEHARRAAGWYAPGAPHVRVAYERLLALGTAAEGLGDRDTALYALRGARTAAIETRWLFTPHEEDLERADAAHRALRRPLRARPGRAPIRRRPWSGSTRGARARGGAGSGWGVVLVAGVGA